MRFFSKRTLLSDSCFLNGFTDYHTHLLPGVDDGVATIDDALAALAGFERRGVKRVWLTPHVMEDFPNTTAGLRARFLELKAAYRGTIELCLAAEYMLDGLFRKRLDENDLLPFDTCYLLVETSCFNPPVGMDDLLRRILRDGYFPVLAHPERYHYMTMDDFSRLKNLGVLFQLNIPSIAGIYGKAIQSTAAKLLQKGMYDFIGSDTHSLSLFTLVNGAPVSRKQIKQLNVLAVLQQYKPFSVIS